MLVAIMSFYFAFLLTAFQLLFSYNGNYDPTNQDDDNLQLYLSMSYIALRNFNFCLVLDIRIASFVELFVYSIGEFIILIFNTLMTLNALEFFDNGGC
jgi:hypothetical protein